MWLSHLFIILRQEEPITFPYIEDLKDGNQLLHTEDWILQLHPRPGVKFQVLKHPDTQQDYIDDINGSDKVKPVYVSKLLKKESAKHGVKRSE